MPTASTDTHDFHKFESFSNCTSLSLPLQLKALGYRTAHIGKLHVAPESVYHFDAYLREEAGQHNSPERVKSCIPLFEEKSDHPFFLCFWTNDAHRSGDVVKNVPEDLKPNRFGNPPPDQQYGETAESLDQGAICRRRHERTCAKDSLVKE